MQKIPLVKKTIEKKSVAKDKKPMHQARNWCFTDFELLKWEKIYNDNKEIIRYICFGEEKCPKTGKIHFQGWLQLINKKTLGGVKLLVESKKIHLEACLGSEFSNEKYCKKDGKSKQFGNFIVQGHRTDLEEIKKKLDEGATMKQIADDHFGDYLRYNKGLEKYKALVDKEQSKGFRQVETIVLEGKTEVGKTRLAMEEATYKIEGNALKWWDGYEGDECILIDEFANQVPITEMLNLLDGYQLRLSIKGCHTYARWKKVYITTNLTWEEWYPNANQEHRKALKRRIREWRTLSIPEISKVAGNTKPATSLKNVKTAGSKASVIR